MTVGWLLMILSDFKSHFSYWKPLDGRYLEISST